MGSPGDDRDPAGGTAVCTLSGVIDLASAPWVFADVEAASARAGLARLVLDVGAVTFVDSSGLAVFVQAHNRARQRQFTLELRNTPPALSELFRRTGLDTVFGVAGPTTRAMRSAR